MNAINRFKGYALLIVISLVVGGTSSVWAIGGRPVDIIEKSANDGKVANEKAVEAEKQIAANPDDVAAKQQLKQAQEERRQADQVRDETAAQYPNSYPVQKAAAEASVKVEDWKAATRYGQRSVSLAANDPTKLPGALKDLAFAQSKTGDYENAAVNAKRALDLKPTDKRLVYELMGIYQDAKGRINAGGDESVSRSAAAGADGSSGSPNSTSSMPRRESRTLARDLKVGAMTEQLNADMTNMVRSLGLKEYDQAFAAAKHAGTVDPGMGNFMLGQIWAELKNFAQAIDAMTKSIDRFRRDRQNDRLAQALTQRASLNNDAGNPKRDAHAALKDATEAIELAPHYAHAYGERASAEETLNRLDEAEADLRAQAENDPRLAAALDAFYDRHPKSDAAASRRRAAAAGFDPAGWAARNGLLLVGAVGGLFLLGAAYVLFASDRPKGRFTELSTPSPEGDGSTVELGKYSRGRKIGEGGMGAVYEGRDQDLQRRVAIKSLRSELQSRERERARFVQEARNVAALHHPNIIEIYDIFQSGDGTYIVFEFVEGATLHERLNQSPGRRLAPRLALEYLRQMADALDHAHARGIVHRDLKPANVMIDEHGRIKVMDFGISRLAADTMRDLSTNTIVGTPMYMAPEQSLGKVGKALDVYALGVTLHEMLTGAAPFHGDDLSAKVEKRYVSASTLQPGLPPAIDAVIARALDPEPEKRHRACAELYADACNALRTDEPAPGLGRKA